MQHHHILTLPTYMKVFLLLFVFSDFATDLWCGKPHMNFYSILLLKGPL